MLAIIPFSGFYNSRHDEALDDALQQAVSDEYGNLNGGLYSHAMSADWQAINVAYAEAYTKEFSQRTGIACQFESLSSPREYNFTTDRVFVTIEPNEVMRLFQAVNPDTLTEVCDEMFKSRSGFMSYYSPDWKEWGGADKFDHNQIWAIIAAYVHDEMADDGKTWDDAEWNIPDSFSETGKLDAILDTDKLIVRLANIAYYLRQRSSR